MAGCSTSIAPRSNTPGTAARTVSWYLLDYQNSVTHVLDSSGVTLGEIAYDGFGVITSDTTGNDGDRYKYTGREWDAATGLQYNRARYYDPSLGRWITTDPIGFAAGDANLYRYVGNGATNWADPSGLKITGVSQSIGNGVVSDLAISCTPYSTWLTAVQMISDWSEMKASVNETLAYWEEMRRIAKEDLDDRTAYYLANAVVDALIEQKGALMLAISALRDGIKAGKPCPVGVMLSNARDINQAFDNVLRRIKDFDKYLDYLSQFNVSARRPFRRVAVLRGPSGLLT